MAMRRPLPIITVPILAASLLAAVPATASAQEPSTLATAGISPGDIVGYWEGTDPLDAGHATRTFTRNADGKISLMGDDTHVTLCGGGDNATYSFSDGVTLGPWMASNNFIVQCLPLPGASVRLHARYRMISANQMEETLTRADTGAFVTKVTLTKLSCK
jgi:hypothetical protein